ncbi:hypothetical protein SAMN05216262_101663 [Colwellia chukchiensis]|uniref:Transglutaminase-like superfamily protein n=1 Tax=Colwellia chukchiensis TaxID=641665 RepID=A0A1H7I033_9GAMM|nr:hypothetical protein [Colwellia chukchiensis]SEK55963.1 hypothetical protein SAMN05216262_101663 [Colwellia chukchiensis]
MKLFQLMILLSCFSSLLMAKQLKFNKVINDNQVQFHYLWLDQDQQQHALSFAIQKTAVFNDFRNFKAFKSQRAQRYVNLQLAKTLSQQPLDGVQLKFLPASTEFTITIKAESALNIRQAKEKIQRMQHQLMQQYLADNFYHQFVNYDHSTAIKPDHLRFAQDSISHFNNVKIAVLSQLANQDARTVINYVLSFVQAIPYATLASRVTASGAGFNPPLQLLWQNQGDCDSKVTLTAAILAALLPQLKMQLLFINNHALMAFNIPSQGQERTVTIAGQVYVLAEPTGPAAMRIGEVSPEAEFAIRNNRYYSEAFINTRSL